MEADALQSTLDLLPAHQHAAVRERISESESFGWTNIRLNRLHGQTGKSDETDLIGEKPNGDTRPLP